MFGGVDGHVKPAWEARGARARHPGEVCLLGARRWAPKDREGTGKAREEAVSRRKGCKLSEALKQGGIGRAVVSEGNASRFPSLPEARLLPPLVWRSHPETRRRDSRRLLRTLHFGQSFLLRVCHVSSGRMARETQALMGSLLKRTNWNPMPPRLDVRLSGHRKKCSFHTQQKEKVLFPNHTHKPHIYTRPVREPPSPPGLLALRPVCSEEWARQQESTVLRKHAA